MAEFATQMGDPHGDPQTSPQHADPHGFLVSFSLQGPKSMWIGVLWAGLRVATWITHVGGRQISPWPARKVTENGIFGNLPFGICPLSRGPKGPRRTKNTM